MKGKAVIILRHEPQQKNPHSPFDGDKHSMHAPLMRKSATRIEHGAAAVLFVTDEVEIRDKVAAHANAGKNPSKRPKSRVRCPRQVKHGRSRSTRRQNAFWLLRVIENLKTQGKDLGKEFDPLLPFERGDRDAADGCPVVHVRRLLDRSIVQSRGQPTLAKLEADIDNDLKPHSRSR